VSNVVNKVDSDVFAKSGNLIEVVDKIFVPAKVVVPVVNVEKIDLFPGVN
jgi:hypothetical protein